MRARCGASASGSVPLTTNRTVYDPGRANTFPISAPKNGPTRDGSGSTPTAAVAVDVRTVTSFITIATIIVIIYYAVRIICGERHKTFSSVRRHHFICPIIQQYAYLRQYNLEEQDKNTNSCPKTFNK